MKKVNFKYNVIGNVDQYPVINTLFNEFKNCNYNHYKRCTTTLREYNEFLKNISNSIKEKVNKVYLYTLIEKDFLSRIDISKSKGNMTIVEHSCMRNLIIAIYRYKLSLLNYHKLGIKKSKNL